ncbi:MAG: hypothetical protein H8E83_00230, partial [Planctomycetes bacterium]|nr:hypothetical protein [Planctomycetota bacterium]
ATAISIYFAIDANHQLVRNEKLLLFAKDALTVQREILEQHTGYWKMHSSLVKARVDVLTEGEVLLRVQMYELLGGQSNTQRISPEIYKEAYQLASGQVGKNHPMALILEAKHIATGGVLDENGEIDAETSVRRMQSLLERWQGGLPEQHAELLYQVARVELASPKAEVRKVGHEHAIHSEEIARTFYIEGEDEKPVVQPIGRRVWSLIFQEGDAISLTKAIALLNEQALPILQKKYDPADIRILKTMAYLAIAHLQRSYHKNGAEQLEDIEEALRVNEFVVAEIVKQSGDGYNIAWQVMNNLAMSLSAKARWLETNNINQTSQEGTNQNPEMLKQRAASIWWRIMQQVHFKDPSDPAPHVWYLNTFQAEIPELAPSDEEHAEWQKKMDWLP